MWRAVIILLSLALFFGCGGASPDESLISSGQASDSSAPTISGQMNQRLVADAGSDTTVDGDAASYDYEGWVVGWSGYLNSRQAVIYHDDHDRWSREELPHSVSDHSYLSGVAFLSPDNGWAVGGEYKSMYGEGLVLHRDAYGWSRADIPVMLCTGFSKVEFLDANHGWALCSYLIGNGPIAYRYADGLWEPMFQNEWESNCRLYDLAPVAPDEVFSSASTEQSSGGLGVLFKYMDGALAAVMVGAWFDYFEGLEIAGGDGDAANCNWRMGYSAPNLYHYSGASWSWAPANIHAGCVAEFARAPGGAWYGTMYNGRPFLIKKSGKGWVEMDIPPGRWANPRSGLHDLAFPADDFGVTVGDKGFGLPGVRVGYAIRYDGVEWRSIPDLMNQPWSFHGVSYVVSDR